MPTIGKQDTLDLSAQGGQVTALLAQLSHRVRRLELVGTDIRNTTSVVNNTLAMNGQVTITDPATTATVTLPNQQLDTAFLPQLTTEVASGTPSAASLRAHVRSKTVGALTTTFVIELEAAPGGGASVNVNWITHRPFNE